MKVLRFVIAIGVLAAAGCSRHEAAEKSGPSNSYDAAQTRRYLQEVGKIRALINEDNRERMPALIRGQDLAMLGDEASRIEQDKQDLAKLATDGVDPEAVEFTRHFQAILDAYKSVCLDTAELFREVLRDDSANTGSKPLMPEIKAGLAAVKPDTIGTVASLVDRVDQLDAAAKAHAVFLSPIVQKVRDDREKLMAAKDMHHDFTAKMKADFAARYPKDDWTAKDILP